MPEGAIFFMRRVLWIFILGSVIGFFVGLLHLGDTVRVGGASGYFLDGWQVVVGAAFLAVGCLGLQACFDETGAILWRRAIVPIILVAIAAIIVLGLGQSAEEFCGKISCS